jgi:hypothetical protein
LSTTGRRGGTRPRRSTETTIDRAPAVEPEPIAEVAPAAPEAEAQLLDDVATPIAGQRGLRFGRSLGGAFVGTMLVVGLAFGAAIGPGGAFGPTGERPTSDAIAAADGGAGHGGESNGEDGKDGDAKGGAPAGPEQTSKPDDGDGDADPTKNPGDEVDPTAKPDVVEATPKPKPEATAKPKPDATPKPTEKPDPTKDPSDPIWLELAMVELHPKVAWGSCDGLDFDYYKVVRSTDSTVSWPAGDGDEVFAAVERGGTRKAYDKNAPHAAKAWYRVFCVRKGEDGYKVVNASATKAIWVPEEPTPPDPVDLALSAEVNGEGKVVLDWSACEVDGFAFYKVVKSTSNDNPSYLPWTDGSEVIAVVEAMDATEWLDGAPDSGQTAWYRVQCIGYGEYGKVLLGQTAVVAVTTPEG